MTDTFSSHFTTRKVEAPKRHQLLQEVVRDPNYLQHFVTPVTEPKNWDDRHHLGKVPHYDAMNDRYCKWVRKKRLAVPADRTGPVMERLMTPPLASTFAGMAANTGGVGPMHRSWPARISPEGGAQLPPIQQGWASLGHSVDPQPPAQPRGRDVAPVHQLSTMTNDDGMQKFFTAADLRRPKMSRASIDLGSQGPSHQLPQLFAKSRQTIMDLWNSLGIPEADRQQFAAVAFAEVNSENLRMLNEEIQHLIDRRTSTFQVEKNIEIREGFLYLLMDLTERVGSGTFDRERVTKEALQLANQFRNSSLDVVEAIVKWREVLRNPRAPYVWKGTNYLMKMQDDISFLAYSRIAPCLDFNVLNNPFLYTGRGRDRDRTEEAAPRSPKEEVGGKLQTGLILPTSSGPRMRYDQLLSSRQAVDVQAKPQQLPPVKQKRGEATPADPLYARIMAAELVLREEVKLHAAASKGTAQSRVSSQHQTASGSTHMMGEDDVPEEIDRAEGDPDDPSAEAVPEEDWLTGNLSRQHALERRAATRIQAVWRGYSDRQYLDVVFAQRNAAIKIQRLARSFLAKSEVRRRRHRTRAARRIQAVARGMLARSAVATVKLENAAATRIQSAWRGHCGRVLAKHHRYAKLAATDIQRVWRGYWVRQHLKVYDHAKRNYHALMIQRLWRGYRVRRCPDFNPAKVRAAILIQAWWKGIETREFSHWLKHHHLTATRIQAWWRGCLARMLADGLREHKQEEDFRVFLKHADSSALDIQRVWRGFQTRQRFRGLLTRQRQELASVSIQKLYRGFAVRQDVTAAQLAQVRASAAVAIQAHVRGWLARRRCRQLQATIAAATDVQRVFRGHLARQSFGPEKTCKVTEDSIPASFGEDAVRAMQQDSAAQTIQRFARCGIARARVAHIRTTDREVLRRLEEKSRREEMEQAATLVQSLARGVSAQQLRDERLQTREGLTTQGFEMAETIVPPSWALHTLLEVAYTRPQSPNWGLRALDEARNLDLFEESHLTPPALTPEETVALLQQSAQRPLEGVELLARALAPPALTVEAPPQSSGAVQPMAAVNVLLRSAPAMGSGLRALQELAVRNSPTAVPASPPAAASPTRLRPFTPNRPYDGLNRLATLAAKAGGFEGVEVLQMLAQRSLASPVKPQPPPQPQSQLQPQRPPRPTPGQGLALLAGMGHLPGLAMLTHPPPPPPAAVDLVPLDQPSDATTGGRMLPTLLQFSSPALRGLASIGRATHVAPTAATPSPEESPAPAAHHQWARSTQPQPPAEPAASLTGLAAMLQSAPGLRGLRSLAAAPTPPPAPAAPAVGREAIPLKAKEEEAPLAGLAAILSATAGRSLAGLSYLNAGGANPAPSAAQAPPPPSVCPAEAFGGHQMLGLLASAAAGTEARYPYVAEFLRAAAHPASLTAPVVERREEEEAAAEAEERREEGRERQVVSGGERREESGEFSAERREEGEGEGEEAGHGAERREEGAEAPEQLHKAVPANTPFVGLSAVFQASAVDAAHFQGLSALRGTLSHVAPAAPLPRTFQDFEALEIMLGAAQAAALGQNQGIQLLRRLLHPAAAAAQRSDSPFTALDLLQAAAVKGTPATGLNLLWSAVEPACQYTALSALVQAHGDLPGLVVLRHLLRTTATPAPGDASSVATMGSPAPVSATTQYEGLATVMRVPQLDPAAFGPLHALAQAMRAAPPAAAQPAAGPVPVPVPVPATVVAAQASAPREVAPLPLLLSEMGVDLASMPGLQLLMEATKPSAVPYGELSKLLSLPTVSFAASPGLAYLADVLRAPTTAHPLTPAPTVGAAAPRQPFRDLSKLLCLPGLNTAAFPGLRHLSALAPPAAVPKAVATPAPGTATPAPFEVVNKLLTLPGVDLNSFLGLRKLVAAMSPRARCPALQEEPPYRQLHQLLALEGVDLGTAPGLQYLAQLTRSSAPARAPFRDLTVLLNVAGEDLPRLPGLRHLAEVTRQPAPLQLLPRFLDRMVAGRADLWALNLLRYVSGGSGALPRPRTPALQMLAEAGAPGQAYSALGLLQAAGHPPAVDLGGAVPAVPTPRHVLPTPLDRAPAEEQRAVKARIDEKRQAEEARAAADRALQEELARLRQQEVERRWAAAQDAAAAAIQRGFRLHRARGITRRKRRERKTAAAQRLKDEWEALRRTSAQAIEGFWVTASRKRYRGPAALIVQRAWRGFAARRFVRLAKEARTAQRWLQQMEEERREDAAIRIQCAVRQALARERVRRQRALLWEAATSPKVETLQRAWRASLAQQEAQRRRRERDGRAAEQNRLDRQPESALTIQLAYRCHKARVELAHREFLARQRQKERRRDHAALHIQLAWRQHGAYREFKKRKTEQRARLQQQKAAETLENHRLSELQRLQAVQDAAERQALQQAAAACFIQRAYRCYCARFMLRWKRADFDYRQYQRHIKELGLQQGEAATLIQAQVRGLAARTELQRLRKAAAVAAQNRQHLDTAAATIQRAWRCYNARFEAKWRRERKTHQQANPQETQQEAWQREMDAIRAQQAQRQQAQRERAAAARIQRQFRVHLAVRGRRWAAADSAGERERHATQDEREVAAGAIQRVFRGRQGRRRMQQRRAGAV